MKIQLDRVKKAMYQCNLNPHRSVHYSYVNILEYFREIDEFTEQQMIIAISLASSFSLGYHAYHVGSLDNTASLLRKVKKGKSLSLGQLRYILGTVDYHFGVFSMLLHLVDPDSFPVIDSAILYFLKQPEVRSSRHALRHYLTYTNACKRAVGKDDFQIIYDHVCSSIGHTVPRLHALTIVMQITGVLSSEGAIRPI